MHHASTLLLLLACLLVQTRGAPLPAPQVPAITDPTTDMTQDFSGGRQIPLPIISDPSGSSSTDNNDPGIAVGDNTSMDAPFSNSGFSGIPNIPINGFSEPDATPVADAGPQTATGAPIVVPTFPSTPDQQSLPPGLANSNFFPAPPFDNSFDTGSTNAPSNPGQILPDPWSVPGKTGGRIAPRNNRLVRRQDPSSQQGDNVWASLVDKMENINIGNLLSSPNSQTSSSGNSNNPSLNSDAVTEVSYVVNAGDTTYLPHQAPTSDTKSGTYIEPNVDPSLVNILAIATGHSTPRRRFYRRHLEDTTVDDSEIYYNDDGSDGTTADLFPASPSFGGLTGPIPAPGSALPAQTLSPTEIAIIDLIIIGKVQSEFDLLDSCNQQCVLKASQTTTSPFTIDDLKRVCAMPSGKLVADLNACEVASSCITTETVILEFLPYLCISLLGISPQSTSTTTTTASVASTATASNCSSIAATTTAY